MYLDNSISVVMATYNGERYIREQLDSVVHQTILPDELLISDDGSIDGTLYIIEEYKRQYPFISVIHNRNDHGPSGNFIAAFEESKGDIIFPCDQDDIWKPEKIERMVEAFEAGVDIVAAQDEILEENTGEVRSSSWGFPSIKETMWKNHLDGHACAFRRCVLDVYSEKSQLSFDYLLCLHGSLTGRSKTINEPLVVWRRHSDSCTSEKLTEDSQIPLGKFGKLRYAIRECQNGRKSDSVSLFMHEREMVMMRMGG